METKGLDISVGQTELKIMSLMVIDPEMWVKTSFQVLHSKYPDLSQMACVLCEMEKQS